MINKKKNGRYFFTEKTITPIVGSKGGITHFVSTDKDITERKLAEQHFLSELKKQRKQLEQTGLELRRSNEELDQFASIASHDLQEPLRTITTYLQILERKNRDLFDEESKEYLSFAIEKSKSLRVLIQELLAFSRVGKKKAIRQQADAAVIVSDALANLKCAILQSNATITVDPLPHFLTDRAKLTQVFQNLIGNAIKYRSEATPRIRICAERRDAGWRFQVSDNGVGIAPEGAEKIFEMFRRLPQRVDLPGSGIGLAIVKKIIEQLGGRIWVESSLGRGSTFFFYLPDEHSAEGIS